MFGLDYDGRPVFWENSDPEGRSSASVGHGGTIAPSSCRTKENVPEYRDTGDDELSDGFRAVV